MDTINWTCGKCFKVFRTNKHLKRHLDEWHQYTDCKLCGKTLKQGSLFRHTQIFHKGDKQSTQLNLFTEEEVNQLNKILESQLSSSLEDLMNTVNTDKSQVFNNLDMTDYLKVFDQITNTPSSAPTEEEFQQIQDYWINMNEQQFQQEEENLLEWAAITL